MKGLKAEGIVVRFGGLVALDHVDVEVTLGRITGLIGPNGAGKTTMFNVCCGFQKADEGRVTFDDVDLTHETPAHRARRGLGRTFQRMQLFRSLTVRENIEIAAESSHITDDPLTQLGIRAGGAGVRAAVRAKADALLQEVGLADAAEHTAGQISTGQGRLVELARVLARDPHVLLLDEPSSGLDPSETATFAELLLRLIQARPIGILLVEHDMSLVLKVSEWIQVLDFGKFLMAGSPAEVRASEVVRAAYLGREGAA